MLLHVWLFFLYIKFLCFHIGQFRFRHKWSGWRVCVAGQYVYVDYSNSAHFPIRPLDFSITTSHVHSYAVEMSGCMLFDLVPYQADHFDYSISFSLCLSISLFLTHSNTNTYKLFTVRVFSSREYVNNIRQFAISKYHREFIYVLFFFCCNSFSNNFSKERTQVNSLM